MKLIGNRISYLRNPFARHSFFCLGWAVLGAALAAASMYLSVRAGGQGGPNTGALGLSSVIAALVSVWYGLLSFAEREKNYLLARIGVAVGIVLLLAWAAIVLAGIFL